MDEFSLVKCLLKCFATYEMDSTELLLLPVKETNVTGLTPFKPIR